MLDSSRFRITSPRKLVLCSSEISKKNASVPRKGQASTGQKAKDRERKTLSGFSSLSALLSKANEAKLPQRQAAESGRSKSEVASEASPNAPARNLLPQANPVVARGNLLEPTMLDNQAQDPAQQAKTQNSVGPSQPSFGETVWAALQLSAFERQKSKAQRRRRVHRAGVTTTVQPLQREVASVGEVKPLVIKAEWATKLQDLEQKMETLKRIYYDKL